MIESKELDVSNLSKEYKTFITQNISNREKVILIYSIHEKAFLIDNWGIAALTDQRVLCWGLPFEIYKLKPGVIFDEDREDFDEEKLRNHKYNLQRFEITQVYARKTKVCVGMRYRTDLRLPFELRIPFSNEEHANKFLQFLERVVAGSVDAPTSIDIKTSAKDIADQLEKLAQLRKDGILSEQEFQTAKRKLLS